MWDESEGWADRAANGGADEWLGEWLDGCGDAPGIDGVLLGLAPARAIWDRTRRDRIVRDRTDPTAGGDEPARFLLANRFGAVEVCFPDDLIGRDFSCNPLWPMRFRIDTIGDDGCLWLSEGYRLPGAHALDHLPPATCPAPDVIATLRDLLAGIATDPLRDFVHGVLEDRAVHAHFWTMPASQRHHHATPGGLARHSLEVAQDMAAQGALTATEHDLGVAGGLLHDIGKVWSYTADMFPSEEGLAMGHELTGLCHLELQLRAQEGHWAHGAYAMRVLLSGCAKPRADGTLPSALLARIRACDQRSCERDAAHKSRPGRSWIPQPYRAKG